MRAVQGVLSTPMGVYIDVHDQGARKYNDEMRSISAVSLIFEAVNRGRYIPPTVNELRRIASVYGHNGGSA